MRTAMLLLRIQLLWIHRLATKPEDWSSARETLADCARLAATALEQLASIEAILEGTHDQVA